MTMGERLLTHAELVAAGQAQELAAFGIERSEKRRARRPRWEIAYARAKANAALLRASETLAHADGDDTLAYRCEATMNAKLAAAVDSTTAYGPPLTPKQHHAVIASALLDGIYVGDLP